MSTLKIVIFTSNAIRHKFFANSLSKQVDDCLVVVESKPQNSFKTKNNSKLTPIESHFYERYMTELEFFRNNESFLSKTLQVPYHDANSSYVYEEVKKFHPDMVFVFGSSILKDETLRLAPSGQFLNMHLGLSPYYRGSGTNFWPFVNNELDYVGATILHLDPGIDTGDIVLHTRPTFENGDNVHTIGCKTIKQGTNKMIQILKQFKEGKKIQRTKQWSITDGRYYLVKDFNEDALTIYQNNMGKNIIQTYINSPKKNIKLIELHF